MVWQIFQKAVPYKGHSALILRLGDIITQFTCLKGCTILSRCTQVPFWLYVLLMSATQIDIRRWAEPVAGLSPSLG
eukprot:355279-Chlamydomonas_euryale.AAC.1